MIFFTITKNYVDKYLKNWSLFLLIILLAFFQQISLGKQKHLTGILDCIVKEIYLTKDWIAFL